MPCKTNLFCRTLRFCLALSIAANLLCPGAKRSEFGVLGISFTRQAIVPTSLISERINPGPALFIRQAAVFRRLERILSDRYSLRPLKVLATFELMSIFEKRGGPYVYGVFMPLIEELLRLGFSSMVDIRPVYTFVVLFPIAHALMHTPHEERSRWRNVVLSAGFGMVGIAVGCAEPTYFNVAALGGSWLAHSLYNLYAAGDFTGTSHPALPILSILNPNRFKQSPAVLSEIFHTSSHHDLAMAVHLAETLDEVNEENPAAGRVRSELIEILNVAVSKGAPTVQRVAKTALAKAQYEPLAPILLQQLVRSRPDGRQAQPLLAYYAADTLADMLVRTKGLQIRIRGKNPYPSAFFIDLLQRIEKDNLWWTVVQQCVSPNPSAVIIYPLVQMYITSSARTKSRIQDLMMYWSFLPIATFLLGEESVGDSAEALFSDRIEWAPYLLKLAGLTSPHDARAWAAVRTLIRMGAMAKPSILNYFSGKDPESRLAAEAVLNREFYESDRWLLMNTLNLYGVFQTDSGFAPDQVTSELTSPYRPIVESAAGAILRIRDPDSFSELLMQSQRHPDREARRSLTRSVLRWDPSILREVDLEQAFRARQPAVQQWAHDEFRKRGFKILDYLLDALDRQKGLLRDAMDALISVSPDDTIAGFSERSFANHKKRSARYHALLREIADDGMIEILSVLHEARRFPAAVHKFNKLNIHAVPALLRYINDPQIGAAAEFLLYNVAQDDDFKSQLKKKLEIELAGELSKRVPENRAKVRQLSEILLSIDDEDIFPVRKNTLSVENLLFGMLASTVIGLLFHSGATRSLLYGVLAAVPVHYLIHEGAHAWAAYLEGQRVRFHLSWKAVSVELKYHTLRNSLAGPLSGLVYGLVCWLCGWITQSIVFQSAGVTLISVNLFAGFYRASGSDAEHIYRAIQTLREAA